MSPSVLIFAAIKSKLGIYALHISPFEILNLDLALQGSKNPYLRSAQRG